MSTSAPDWMNPLFNVCLTENGDLTHLTSLDACLDFFYKVLDTTAHDRVQDYLRLAWAQDPQRTLRLVFYLLDVRNGKSGTAAALTCLQWLYDSHPQTLLANVGYVGEFGCIRDLAMLLMLIRLKDAKGHSMDWWKEATDPRKQRTLDHDALYRSMRSVLLPTAGQELQSAIVDLFVKSLKADNLSVQQEKGVSLYSKWLPSQDSYLNRSTCLYDKVALAMYERDSTTNITQGSSRSADRSCSTAGTSKAPRRPLILARNHLRRNYISPLRRYAGVTETLMSSREWTGIPYSKVPSKCMARNATHFARHDKEGFDSYLQDLVQGKSKVNASTLKPHEICFPKRRRSEVTHRVAEAQWNNYTATIKEHGSLQDTLAVCDVSGSMTGQPMKVAISLSLLVASVAKPPWRSLLITFSEEPDFHVVEGQTLKEQLTSIRRMHWGCNTNFDRVFNVILEKAQNNAVEPEKMPKTLFVFSDMQFDEADGRMDSTAFDRIKEKYAASGYNMPQIVFWNLRDSSGVPVEVTDTGTALVSGFSGNLLKLFLEGQDFVDTEVSEDADAAGAELLEQKPQMSPTDVMLKAIGHERYNVLKVID